MFDDFAGFEAWPNPTSEQKALFWGDIPLMTGSSRRERILLIPVVQIVAILSGQAEVKLPDQIPADAIALRTFQDDSTNSVCVVMTHPNFPINQAGFSLPKYELDVVFPLNADKEKPQDLILEVEPVALDEREV